MKKIKILYEGISENLGGIETFIYNLYKNIDKERFEVSFLLDKELKIPFQEEYENEIQNEVDKASGNYDEDYVPLTQEDYDLDEDYE